MMQTPSESPEKKSLREAVDDRANIEEQIERDLQLLLTKIQLRNTRDHLPN